MSLCSAPNLVIIINIITITAIVIIFAVLSVSFLHRRFNECEMMTVGGRTRKQIPAARRLLMLDGDTLIPRLTSDAANEFFG